MSNTPETIIEQHLNQTVQWLVHDDEKITEADVALRQAKRKRDEHMAEARKYMRALGVLGGAPDAEDPQAISRAIDRRMTEIKRANPR